MPIKKGFDLSAAALGAFVGYFYGGWSNILTTLVLFILVDFVTGTLAGAGEDGLSSAVGFNGIKKKVTMMILVGVTHQVDMVVGGGGHVTRDATAFFYMANELISIAENCGRLGLPLPKVVMQAIAILKTKGGEDNGNDQSVGQ